MRTHPDTLAVAGTDIAIFDEVRISGRTCSPGGCTVTDMPAVVATLEVVAGEPGEADSAFVKVWPDADDWPGLPADHPGKIWFDAADVTRVVVDRRADW